MVDWDVIVVPWFSKSEWLEVYHAVFSDDINRWKEAKDTILVWQARVEKLPAGVDVTLPLLQARIMDEDTTADTSVKSIFLASAVHRFVSAILKLPQTRYYKTKTLHHLALEIGLPVHLVDLRNEIIHGHGGWAASETVHSAVETCYQWIKGFYWDKELKRIENMENSQKQIANSEEEEEEENFVVPKNFTSLLKSYSIHIRNDATKKNRSEPQIKVCNRFLKLLEGCMPDGIQQCIEILVSDLLLFEIPNGSKKNKPNKKKNCECFFEHWRIAGINPLFQYLSTVESALEILISILITKSKENAKLAEEWIYLIVGSILGTTRIFSKDICPDNILTFGEIELTWKKIVIELMETEQAWAVEIAGRIMECNELGFTKTQRDNLLKLFNALKSTINDSESESYLQIYTVDDLKEAAKQKSGVLSYKVENTLNSVLYPGLELDCGIPLGILPHQKGNSTLYKELLLHYPDSTLDQPQNKRIKVSY